MKLTGTMMVAKRLNPSFSGISFLTVNATLVTTMTILRLNPSFSGISFLTVIGDRVVEILYGVLILLFLEYHFCRI